MKMSINHAAHPGRLKRSQAFTLVEVVSTLVLVSLLISMVGIHQARTNVNVNGAAQRLKAHLRYAQTLNAADNTTDWQMFIGPKKYSLRKGIYASPIPLPGSQDYVQWFPGKVQMVGARNMYVSFDEYGSPGDTDVVIHLWEKRGWIITGHENRYDIVIKAHTGHIP